MTIDGALTDAGRELHRELEAATDAIALSAYHALDHTEQARLLDVLTPIARAVVAAGDIPAATPMGPTLEP
jgi:hypothetical protein